MKRVKKGVRAEEEEEEEKVTRTRKEEGGESRPVRFDTVVIIYRLLKALASVLSGRRKWEGRKKNSSNAPQQKALAVGTLTFLEEEDFSSLELL